jgi:hypothetical protein
MVKETLPDYSSILVQHHIYRNYVKTDLGDEQMTLCTLTVRVVLPTDIVKQERDYYCLLYIPCLGQRHEACTGSPRCIPSYNAFRDATLRCVKPTRAQSARRRQVTQLPRKGWPSR